MQDQLVLRLAVNSGEHHVRLAIGEVTLRPRRVAIGMGSLSTSTFTPKLKRSIANSSLTIETFVDDDKLGRADLTLLIQVKITFRRDPRLRGSAVQRLRVAAPLLRSTRAASLANAPNSTRPVATPSARSFCQRRLHCAGVQPNRRNTCGGQSDRKPSTSGGNGVFLLRRPVHGDRPQPSRQHEFSGGRC